VIAEVLMILKIYSTAALTVVALIAVAAWASADTRKKDE